MKADIIKELWSSYSQKDYNTHNACTVPAQYTTAHDALDCLLGSRWFSVLDLRVVHYWINMSKEDKNKTTVIRPLGFDQFERMPQAATGGQATF